MNLTSSSVLSASLAAAAFLASNVGMAAPGGEIFPTDLKHTGWLEFPCDGFSVPVSGVVFGPDEPTCCGVPLGGVGTGCLDIEVGGVLGFETLFDGQPRRSQLMTPFLGLSLGGKTYVLAAQKYLDGGTLQGCLEPRKKKDAARYQTTLVKIEGASAAKQIHYFGHYPVVDIEYELDAPLSVGLRAWSPFLPGDAKVSNTPAAVFEVRMRNTSDAEQTGTLAFSFPGIPPIRVLHEGRHTFARQALSEPVGGVAIGGPNQIGYVLGVIGDEKVRSGAQLSSDGMAWAKIASELPGASPDGSGASVAVDLKLPAGQSRTVRFLLAWYSPTFIGHADKPQQRYTTFYATRFGSATDVARRMVKEHDGLLRRVLAWQEVVYADKDIPIWLRDTLIQTLCLIPETSYWTAPKGHLAEWVGAEGYFAMNESPRGCSHIECIPCTYYGGIPVTYFFPELNRTTLRAYARFQRADGAAPFDLGPCCAEVGLVTPSHDWQKALNSMCFVDLVDRLWLRTGDRGVLQDLYPAVRKATQYTVAMSANHGPDAVISIPDDVRSEWWEGFDWYGMTAHAGGLRISNMAMAARMAEAMGDQEFAEQCRQWLRQGQASMENKMWNEAVGSYLLYRHEKLGKTNDTIMSNQFDGEWNNDFHGLPGIFRKDRVDRALTTIKKSCMAPYGAVSFAKPDLTPLVTYGIFPPEIMMLGFTYLYEGDRQTGLEVLHNCLQNLYLKHRHGWDLPNTVSGPLVFTAKTAEGREGISTAGEGTGEGQRTFGTDYYQNMMLWSAPAALAGTELTGPCKPGGLVHRIIEAARGK